METKATIGQTVRTSEPQLEFTDITALDGDRVMDVLRIRNEPDIRKNMYTDHIIQPDEHLGWVKSLDKSQSAVFFAVMFDGAVIGGASLTAISRAHRRADWAFYISKAYHGRGLGSALERQFIDMAFEKFGIEKLNCEVISFNETVVEMHKRFGFIVEGERRNHVVRDGKRYNTVLLGMTKEEWNGRMA